MKLLNITTIGGTQIFFLELFKRLRMEGHSIDLASNELLDDYPEKIKELGLKTWHIDCSRSPKSLGNIKAIGQIRAIAANGNYDIVHCHTPLAAAACRLACRGLRKKGLRVIYTAHGFHFYKGAPLINWLIYYPVEWICSHWTDTVITMNKEDFEFAQRKFKYPKVEYIPGIGIDTEKIRSVSAGRAETRKELGVPEEVIMLLSVGELSRRKNHSAVIKAMAALPSDIHYVIAGGGPLEEELKSLIKENNLSGRVQLLGYRKDAYKLYHAADVCVLPSFQEGLSVALMEGMAAGLPCIVSDIRGNRDLIDSKGGLLCSPFCPEEFAKAAEKLQDKELRDAMGERNAKAVEGFSSDAVIRKMKEIYGIN